MRKNGGSSFGLLFDDAKIYKIYLLQPIFVQKTYFLPIMVMASASVRSA